MGMADVVGWHIGNRRHNSTTSMLRVELLLDTRVAKHSLCAQRLDTSSCISSWTSIEESYAEAHAPQVA